MNYWPVLLRNQNSPEKYLKSNLKNINIFAAGLVVLLGSTATHTRVNTKMSGHSGKQVFYCYGRLGICSTAAFIFLSGSIDRLPTYFHAMKARQMEMLCI